MKLNLGCGADFRPGWINVDLRPLYREGPEFICADLCRLDSRIPDGEVSQIVARHVLQFISWRDVDAALCCLARKLCRGGTLEVRVPDLEAAMRDYAEDNEAFPALQRALYGSQGYPEEVHRSAWTAPWLRQRLAMVGLVVQDLRQTGGHLEASAIREAV
jgi:predicted SAM-dependent methyltransferase